MDNLLMQTNYTHPGFYSTGQILDLGVRIYHRNFWRMTIVATLAILPGSLVYGVSFAFMQEVFFNETPLFMLIIGLLEGLFLQGWCSLLITRIAQDYLTDAPTTRLRDLLRVGPRTYLESMGASAVLGFLGTLTFLLVCLIYFLLLSGSVIDLASLMELLLAAGALFLGSTWASMSSAYMMLFFGCLIFLGPLINFLVGPGSNYVASQLVLSGASNLGVLAVILAGLFFFSRSSLVFPVMRQENIGLGQAIRRSWQLTRGENRRAMLVASAVAWLVFLFNIPLRASAVAGSVMGEIHPILMWVLSGQISLIISLPLRNAIMAAYYHQLRVSKEAYDLFIEPPPTPAP
jgi:hypothetical protein